MLVSEQFDGVPWLERVHQCGSLWDASEMGDRADVHCYTPAGVRAQARLAARRGPHPRPRHRPAPGRMTAVRASLGRNAGVHRLVSAPSRDPTALLSPARHAERRAPAGARLRRARPRLRGDRRALPAPARALPAARAQRPAGRGRPAGDVRERVALAAARHRRARPAPVAVPHRPQPGRQRAVARGAARGRRRRRGRAAWRPARARRPRPSSARRSSAR